MLSGFQKIASKVVSGLSSPPASSTDSTTTSDGSSGTYGTASYQTNKSSSSSNKDMYLNEDAAVIFDNLDMHFITNQIIGMSRVTPPPSAPTTQRCNDCPQVSKLISSLHHQDYRQCLLINLSDDSFDEVTLASVGYQCIDVGWVSPGSKSQTPSIPHVFEICYQLQAFLSSNPANLAMILCSNGKTRTGIVIACYLKYSTMCDSSMDGFNLFCERRCSSMSSKKSISQSIPPSLKQFFRNFDDCCELQGFPNPDTLVLKSIAISGVPVDDIPCIDIWSTSSQVYSSISEDDGVDHSSDQHWDEEDGFFKINTNILGDFVILCRFGGEYKKDVNDPTKVLFRYANSTGFMCQGAYELQKDKVDMMKRYASSFDAEDFKVVLLFDVAPSSSSPTSTLPNVCSEGEAYDLGWSALSKHHALIPDSEACEVLTDKGYPVELATVALQLGNNDVQRALELLNDTLGELSERLGFSKRNSSNTDKALLIRRSSSESQLNFVDTSLPATALPTVEGTAVEDESDRFMNALSELNFGFKIDTNSEPGAALISKSSPMSADIKMDSSIVMLTPPVKPTGDEITKAVNYPRPSSMTPQSVNSQRRVTISSYVPRTSSPSPTMPPTAEEEKFVDARNFSTPDAKTKEKRETRSKSAPNDPRLQKLFSDDEDDENDTISTSETSTTKDLSALEEPLGEVKDMLLQLKQAGISLEDLIKLKQGSLPWGEVERRSSLKSPDPPHPPQAPPQPPHTEAAPTADDSEPTPTNPAEAMKAMFARRASASSTSSASLTASAFTSSSAPPKASKSAAPEPPERPPANPAEEMKAMFARRASASSTASASSSAAPEAPEAPPTNPAEAMKAMFARRASASSTASASSSAAPKAPEAPPTNPAEAMKTMLAHRASASSSASAVPSNDFSPSSTTTLLKPPVPPVPAVIINTSAIPLKDMEEYQKYFKMMKTGLPKDVVKHAMTRDGKDPDILDNDPNKSLPPLIPLNKDPRFVKYFKMLKMHIPLPAVKQAMMKDSLDPYILDCPYDKPLPKVVPKPKPPPSKHQKMAAYDQKAPPIKDDEKFTKYFKMQKMGLPVGAIMNSMAKDGLDPKIMEMDHSKSLAQNLAEQAFNATPDVSEAPKVPKRRRKKLDWKPIDKNKVEKDSIWGTAADFNLDLDMDEFDSLFVAKASPDQKLKKSNEGVAKKKKASVQVISGKRGMNGGISLARIKIPFLEIAKAIDNLNESVLTPEQLISLKECLPDRDESSALLRFMKSNSNNTEDLCEAEKFMVAMLKVTNPSEKIDALIFKAHFVHRRNDIIETARTVETACDDVKLSLRLKKLLAIILKVGNQLNHGNDDAHAFTLESLLKLNQAKAFDRKTSILHYLVMLVKRNDESLLKFKEDISSVVKAEKVAYDQTVVHEIKKLEKELESVESIALSEAEKVKEENGGTASSRMSVGDLAGQKTTLVRTSSGITHHDKATILGGDMSLTPIGRFTLDANAAVEETQVYVSKVTKKFRDVLRYFGEEKSMAPMQFFMTLSAFTRAFDQALDDVTKTEKKKAREKRLEDMRAEREQERERKRTESGKADGVLESLKHTTSPDKPKHKKISAGGRRNTTMMSTPPNFGI